MDWVSGGGQMSPAADPPLSSATLGGAWKVTSLGTAGVNPALGSTLHLISRGGQMSPAAEPSPLSATLGGAWKVTSLGTAGVNPALSPTWPSPEFAPRSPRAACR